MAHYEQTPMLRRLFGEVERLIEFRRIEACHAANLRGVLTSSSRRSRLPQDSKPDRQPEQHRCKEGATRDDSWL